jgi:hypothetical protein
MSLYNKDKAEHMDNTGDNNTGLVARRKHFKNSQIVPLIGKLHSDMFFQHKFLLNGVSIKLKLNRNSDKFSLMANSNSAYKVHISSASFYVRKVKINNGIQLKHMERLEKQLQPALYPVRRVSMKSFNIAAGLMSCDENIFNGVLPKRIVIGLVDSDAFEGAYNKNPFNFKHYDLKYCGLLQDGKMIPQKPLISDFDKHNSLRNYFTTLESVGKVFRNEGVDFDREEYEHGYTILAFDLSPDLDPDSCFHVVKKGTCRLELKFATALPNPINVVIYAEFDSTIKIDKNRAVMTNFYT